MPTSNPTTTITITVSTMVNPRLETGFARPI
jgi:hypothetical protein